MPTDRRQPACLIIGLNESAAACALELRRGGVEVALLDREISAGWVLDQFCVGRTPLNAATVSAQEFEQLAVAALESEGVALNPLFWIEGSQYDRPSRTATFECHGIQTSLSARWPSQAWAPSLPRDGT